MTCKKGYRWSVREGLHDQELGQPMSGDFILRVRQATLPAYFSVPISCFLFLRIGVRLRCAFLRVHVIRDGRGARSWQHGLVVRVQPSLASTHPTISLFASW